MSVRQAGRVSVFAAALLLMMSPAGAGVRLLESSPEDGASVQSLEEVEFVFDGLLIPDSAEVFVTRRNGDRVADGVVVVEGERLGAQIDGELTSGDYEITYRVRSADGDLNVGAISLSVDSPAQSLSGGSLAVFGIFAVLIGYLSLVFWRDHRRRSPKYRRRQATETEPPGEQDE